MTRAAGVLSELERSAGELAELRALASELLATVDVGPRERELLRSALAATAQVGTLASKIASLTAAANRPPSGKRHPAAELIRDRLQKDRGWQPARPIIDAAAAAGINERTVQRAVVDLGLERRRAGEFHSPMLWRWPAAATTPARRRCACDRPAVTPDGDCAKCGRAII